MRPPSRLRRVVGRVDTSLRQKLPRPAYHTLRCASYAARGVARRNPGRGRVLPDYLIIGVAKGATTSVYAWLNEHPFVAPAAKKEVHYFDYEYFRGEDWYRSHFPLRRAREAFAQEHGSLPLTGEASPTYISHRWAPERIANDLPDIKLIVVLRDPVDRAYSHYQMTRREEQEPMASFEEAIAAEGARLAPELARVERDKRYNSWPLGCWSYLLRSRYVEQLERWFGLFSREQFH